MSVGQSGYQGFLHPTMGQPSAKFVVFSDVELEQAGKALEDGEGARAALGREGASMVHFPEQQ